MQHANREKTLFSWSVRNMQAGRGFAKTFAKLPNMRREGGFLPSCHILPSRLPNCWRGVLSVFAKNQGCQLHLPNCWRCWASPTTVCQIRLPFLFFWKNTKNMPPTVWHSTWQILATWKKEVLNA